MHSNKAESLSRTRASHNKCEPGLFVIWGTARYVQNEILEDIAARFHIVDVYEMHWSPRMVWANFQRFYSDLEARGIYHQQNKGAGPFLAVIVCDRSPLYQERLTGRGMRPVNTGFFDVKSLYRDWSGGIGVHCSETQKETERDLCMLLGPEIHADADLFSTSWDGSIKPAHQDLAGAHGWKSIVEFLSVLNHTINYVAINYDVTSPTEGFRGESSLDVLTDEYFPAHLILNSGGRIRAHSSKSRQVPVTVGDTVIRVGIRFPGDDYFDANWARQLLDSRVAGADGYYQPREREEFWLLANHQLSRQRSLTRNTRAHLASLVAELGFHELNDIEPDNAGFRRLLAERLRQRGIDFHESPVSLSQNLATGRKRVRSALQHSWASLRSNFYVVRDMILNRAPWPWVVRRSLRNGGLGD